MHIILHAANNLTPARIARSSVRPSSLAALKRPYILAITLVVLSVGAAGQMTSGAVNNEAWVDGVTNTSPQGVYAKSATNNWGVGGGLIHWVNSSGVPVNVVGNAFGNTATPAAPTLSFGGSCTTFAPVTTFSVQLVAIDYLGDVSASSIAISPGAPASSDCLVVTPPASLASTPGIAAYQIQGCAGSCTAFANFVLLASGGSYGPFSALSTAQTYNWNTSGPVSPPPTTTGLVVQDTLITFGTGPFVISVPQVPGQASGITGYKRNVSTLQISPSFPKGIPQLMEPWGQLVSSGSGSGSLTADWVLLDSFTNPVSVSEPHTFPAFGVYNGTTYGAVQLNNPGVPLAKGQWVANTYYWVGERVVVCSVSTTCTTSPYYILQVATAGAGISSSGPNWATNSTCLGSTCSDGTVTWTIVSTINTRLMGHTYPQLGSEVYDPSNNGSFWEAQCAGTTSSGTLTLSGKLGATIVDNGGCNSTQTGGIVWINIGLNTLISPLFELWTATCSTSPGMYTQQCAGGGSQFSTYLSMLKAVSLNQPTPISSVPSANWSGCSPTATCTGVNPTSTTVSTTGLVAGTFPTSPSISFGSCPSFLASSFCPGVAGIVYLQIAWCTPSGCSSPLGEVVEANSWNVNHVLQIAAPVDPPPNAVGYEVFASQTSGNNLLQLLDGVNAYCTPITSGYVSNLPYGRMCAPLSGFAMTNLQTGQNSSFGGNRPTLSNASEIGVGLAGLPITGPWPGGAYGVSINDLSIECGSPFNGLAGNTIEPYAWGVFNLSAEEGSNQNGAGHGMIAVSDCGSGGFYVFGSQAQNSGSGSMHLGTGQVADYTVAHRVEDVGGYRGTNDISIGSVTGSQYAIRSCIQIKTNLISNLGLPQMGELRDVHGENCLEQVDLSNNAALISNVYGRCCYGKGRSSVYGVHVEPFTPDYTVEDIAVLGYNMSPPPVTGCNLQDDTLSPAACLSTESSLNNTLGFFSTGNMLGSTSTNQAQITTDPGIQNQFPAGATLGTMKQLDLTNSGVVGWTSAGMLDTGLSRGSAADVVDLGNGNPGDVSGTLNAARAQLGSSVGSTGQLNLVESGAGTITVQPQPSTTSYNFNLPTGAGTAGQPLLSGGGGSAAMSFSGCLLSNGVNAISSSYTLLASDVGKLVTMNGSSLTATLPASPPTLTWCVNIENLNSSNLTIARNSLTINGGTSNLTLLQFQLVTIWTDGSNYFATLPTAAGSGITLTQATNGQTIGLANSSVTFNGQTVALGSSGNVNSGASQYSVAVNGSAGAAIGGVNPTTTSGIPLISQGASSNPGFAGCLLSNGVNAISSSYTLLASDVGKLVTMNGSSLTATLPASPPTLTWCASIENLNPSSLTVNPNGRTINTGSSNVTLLQYQTLMVWTDGSNYFATLNSGNGALATLCAGAAALTLNGGTTSYVGFGTSNTTESLVALPVPVSGTAFAIHAQMNTPPGSLQTVTIQGRYSGVGNLVNLACTISGTIATSCDSNTAGTSMISEGGGNTWDVAVSDTTNLGSRNYAICIKVTGAN